MLYAPGRLRTRHWRNWRANPSGCDWADSKPSINSSSPHHLPNAERALSDQRHHGFYVCLCAIQTAVHMRNAMGGRE